MRYSMYTLIKNLCDSMIEAVEFIKKNKNSSVIQNLLKDCGQSLSAINNTLQSNTQSIKNSDIFDLINSSDRAIDNISKLVSFEKELEIESLLNKIVKISHICKNDITIKYRIVFIAELGEKWDSLETVYWAFKKRYDCDVSVVIEPIYRVVKGKNGEVKSDIILKDFLTPLGIEHIPFNEYSIEKDKPDMVIISQPYESVTAKEFWPENIAKYSRLVYIPYGSISIVDENERKVSCKMPCAYYSWRIIAQSQKIKEIYIEEAYYHGKNVIVTGLPKWDVMFKSNDNLVKIDSEWKIKFKNKKVFLLNTHFSKVRFLQRCEDFVNYFNNRTDIALLWRPHPMTDTIYKVYYPELLERWNILKDEINKSNNMVIDYNASYLEAFQISDAMLSDMSSMIPQFLLTKKPIFLLVSKDLINIKSNWVVDYSEFNTLSTETSDEWKAFVEHIVEGLDDNLDARLKTINKDFVNADGTIGERVCEILITDLKNELE